MHSFYVLEKQQTKNLMNDWGKMIRSRSKNNFYRDKWVFPFLLIQKTEKLYQKEEQ